jgi:hypothetical protein
MIGAPSYPALTSSVVAIGTTIITPYYGYGVTGYYSEDTLKPGLGYWTKVSGAGKLVVTAAPAIPPESSPSIVAAVQEHPAGKHAVSGMKELEGFQSIQVSDGNRQERTVYFSAVKKEIELEQFELPPPPPGDIFDVRFKSQRMVEMPVAGGKSEFPLQISGAVFPLTFSWEAPAGEASSVLEIRMLDNRVQQYPLTGKGSAVISDENLAGARVKVMTDSKVELPKVFALYQNYPNPFNPTTKIRYDLPKTARVSLKVFDLLGQEVITLFNEEKEAGRYTAELNASILPSGVYYFRLEAGSFSSVRKLLLMK